MSSGKPRIFSGMQPSGVLHIGNYLGALKNWAKIQYDFEPIFCVVDQHAITVYQDPKAHRESIEQVAALYLAAGIDKDNADADNNLISTDGARWTPLATTSQEDRNGSVFFNNTFITVGDGGEIWQSNLFTAPVGNTYASWVSENFPASPPLSAAADDFDGDGVPNHGEYATGTDPRDHGDRANFPAAVAGDHFIITVPKADGVTDVGIVVEHSANLQSWSAVGTTVVEDSASQLVVRITATVSSAVPPRGFLRVRFVQEP